ncbi:hypothetical protein MIR68_010148 [Amoeboaphelidium protococcarum]|nr:hypothetical protein MIR68_010148 [Amoeboaphelidium protococcarum]
MKDFTIAVSHVDRQANNGKDAVYKLEYSTTMDQYSRKSGTDLPRRYSDFVWLQRELQENFPECFVPPVPQMKYATSSSSSGSSGNSGNGYTQLSQTAVDEKTRQMMEEFLNLIVAHPNLKTFQGLQQLLESGANFTPYSASKSGGSSSLFSRVAKSVKSQKDHDPWFEQHKHDLEVYQSLLEKCTKSLEKVTKYQRSLAASYQDVALLVSELGSQEPNIHLAGGLRKLSASFEKTSTTMHLVADTQILNMGEYMVGAQRYAECGQKAMENRVNALVDYESAGKSTLKKKQAADKLKSSGHSTSKIESALQDLNDAKTAESELNALVKKITENIKEREWDNFEHVQAEQVTQYMTRYAVALKENERKQAEDWTLVYNDIKSIDLQIAGHGQVQEAV